MLLFSPGLRSAQSGELKPVLPCIRNGGVHWITQFHLMSVDTVRGCSSYFYACHSHIPCQRNLMKTVFKEQSFIKRCCCHQHYDDIVE